MNEWARKCQSFDTEQLSCPLFWMFVPTNNTTLNVYRTPLTNQSIKLVSVWRQRLPTPLSTRYKTQCINTVSISRQLSSECFLCAIFIVVIFRVRISIRYLQSTKFWVLLVCTAVHARDVTGVWNSRAALVQDAACHSQQSAAATDMETCWDADTRQLFMLYAQLGEAVATSAELLLK